MSLSSMNRTVSMLARLLDTHKTTVPLLETSPQKPPCRPVSAHSLERATPESQGIPSFTITAFLDMLRQDSTLNLHTLLLLRNGKVVAEAAFGTQDPRVWKMTFSACKSIVSLAIGMLMDEGKLALDDRVVDYFPDKTTPVSRLRFKEITIRHLLTMTTGVSFNEAECMTSEDWVRSFFESTFTVRPGKQFAYNSMNTYLLSALICRVSGQSLTEFLIPRLWQPLGISDYYWETCPCGIEKGGWGLYLGNEDMAKIGQLVLQKGRWNERQLVSSQWIELATACHKETPEDYGNFNYGFQIWRGRENTSFLFNGMFGQNVLGFPDNNILLVTTAGNNEMFQQSRFFEIVDRFFSGSFPEALADDDNAYEALTCMQESLRRQKSVRTQRSWWQFWLPQLPPLPEPCYQLDGQVFRPNQTGAASVGLLPLILQTVQNNYSSGLLELRFDVVGDEFLISYGETEEDHRFSVGFDEPLINELYFRGESYRVAVGGRFATNEYDDTVLLVTLDFLETPCTRQVKLVLGQGKVLLYQSECPGEPFMRLLLSELRKKLDARPLIGAAMDKVDDDYIHYKIRAMLSPEVELQAISKLPRSELYAQNDYR